MFSYSDPTGTDRLEMEGALGFWQQVVRAEDVAAARRPGAAITVMEAFEDVPPDSLGRATVPWLAFPKSQNQTLATLDAERLRQDEYVEWRIERDGDDRLRVVFTTEFREWWAVLAAASFEALVRAIQELVSDADPSPAEVFGPDFDPDSATPTTRFRAFLQHLEDNPWNNGTNAILCHQQPNNTLRALYKLVEDCSIHRTDLPANSVCGNVGCVPERNSDPFICVATQNLAASRQVLSLADPVGIRLLSLEGIWKLHGDEIDINDASNAGIWNVSRNGRRGELTVVEGLTLDDDPILHGASVARLLRVGADVIHCSEALVPVWAQTGMESTRLIS